MFVWIDFIVINLKGKSTDMNSKPHLLILKEEDYHPFIIVISLFLHFTIYTCKSHALTIYFSIDQWLMIFLIFSVEYRNDVFQWEKCKHSTCETVYHKLFNWTAADIQRVLFDKYRHSKSGLCYLINLWIICYDATVSNYWFFANI